MPATAATRAPSPARPRVLGWAAVSLSLHAAAFAALAATGVVSGDGRDRPAHLGAVVPPPCVLLRPADPPPPPVDLPERPADGAALPPDADPAPLDTAWAADVTVAADGPPAAAPFAVALGRDERARAARAAARGRPTGAAIESPATQAVSAPSAAPATPASSRAPRFSAAPSAPEYPATARRQGWEGVVRLRLRVDRQGAVTSVEVVESSGRDLLDEAAVRAASSWKLAPALRDGEPAEGALDVPVRFRLED